MNLLTQPMSIVHRTNTATDAYGNETAEDHTPVPTSGYLEQTDSLEVIVGRETYVSNWRCFLPASASISAGDAVVVAGTSYEVIGPPAPQYNPRTRTTSHIECRLRVSVG